MKCHERCALLSMSWVPDCRRELSQVALPGAIRADCANVLQEMVDVKDAPTRGVGQDGGSAKRELRVPWVSWQ